MRTRDLYFRDLIQLTFNVKEGREREKEKEGKIFDAIYVQNLMLYLLLRSHFSLLKEEQDLELILDVHLI